MMFCVWIPIHQGAELKILTICLAKSKGNMFSVPFNRFIIIEQGVKGYNYLDMHFNYCFSNQGCTKESPKRYKKVSTCYSSQIKQRIWYFQDMDCLLALWRLLFPSLLLLWPYDDCYSLTYCCYVSGFGVFAQIYFLPKASLYNNI